MDHTLVAGDGISHYRIVGALGSGGMGEVYLAQDLTLERSVALKETLYFPYGNESNDIVLLKNFR